MAHKIEVPASLIRGDVNDGYDPVADAFPKSFTEKREIGAACTVH